MTNISDILDTPLLHDGVKGMKWGVVNWRKPGGKGGKAKSPDTSFHKESDKKIKTNADGSQTIPKGFVFNRVGKTSLDVNDSGALYVSHGKEDAARYMRNLGPTMMGKLLKNYGEAVQHISVKGSLKVASKDEVSKSTCDLLLKDPQLLQKFNNSMYSLTVTGDFNSKISKEYIEKASANPSGKEAQRLSYGVSSLLGDPNYTSEAKKVYSHFKDKGYDAIPDVHDIMSGTSSTATIVINASKLEVKSVTIITKEHMKAGKAVIKSVAKLKPSELL